ncbi:response regulator [Plastoroseomonas arctica]|uniref:response regulator n=1 Tax=Plastoroseomonas arctica TaxID=1509237 RepID=UPI001BA78DA0|nr:response regulator [Plastoroseomonas arctica]
MPRAASPDLFALGGDMGDRMRRQDWAATPLGPPEHWPVALRTTVRTMLGSRYAMWMAWGPELTFLCNDAYLPTVGIKRDWVLGARSDRVWQEIWPDIGPRIERVLSTGEATWDEALLLFLQRSGFPEETYHTFSYSPLADDDGRISGMLCVVTEETERILGERRLRVLGELGARAKEARSAEDACARAAATLETSPADVPFALIYLLDAEGGRVSLAAHAGLPEDHPAAVGDAAGIGAPWPLRAAAESGLPVEASLDGLPPLPGGPWGDAASRALVLPLAAPGHEQPAGFLVCGVNPRRPLDAAYRSFFELAAGHIGTAVANVRAYEAERRRAESLAELDRAKTAFFSNVSHEFRTPLALMLGPLEELLRVPLPGDQRDLTQTAHRNGLRLLRLVNTLLDFSRVEAGRVQARFAPTDLGPLTADLASAFRSACERAGLRLVVDCPTLSDPVHVDREMWEKIVLNLVSNAFKFTFEGMIAVSLRAADGCAELVVRDTGTGIPEQELPRLFDRFHRVEGAAGRTHEGSGIGLALVRELARLHGGDVFATSERGRGSVFTVRVPLGTAHVPAEALAAAASTAAIASTAARTEAFVGEALRWLPDGEDAARADETLDLAGAELAVGATTATAERILVADDNADMRDYLRRLLTAAGYRVETAPDGEEAAAVARENPPALVLSDVMMPRLDGYGLVRALRADPRTREAPVLLLSARAGEEAEIEGLDAGADDYLVKPFSARELLARVGANLRLARIRREAAAAVDAGEARWRDLLDRMHEGCFIGELVHDATGRAVDFRHVEVNAAVERLTGIPVHRLTGRLASEVLPGIEPFWVETFARVVETGEPAHVEHETAALKRWFELSAYRVGPGRFGALFLDVTARRAAAERQALLTREVDHRAKNALAVVQSVVRLTKASDVREYAHAVEGRVAALARAHTLLSDDRWRGTDLRAVVDEELAAHSGGARVVIAGQALRLRPEAVQPLSMVLHEMATNAVKYGALSTTGGRLSVSWKQDAPDAPVRLCWHEQGGPPIAAAPERRGFGTTLIEATVRGQLDGVATMAWETGGLCCEVTIAPRHLAAADGGGVDRIEHPASGRPAPVVAPRSLRGRAVLVVEDEPLIAMEITETLTRLGCEVIGPAMALDEALKLAAAEAGRLSAAVLDVNLKGRFAFPVAELLSDRGVPVVWATGYGELPPGSSVARGAELLRKPLAEGELHAALRRLLARESGEHRGTAASLTRS